MSSEVLVFLLCENRLLREALVRILSQRSDLLVVGNCAHSPAVLDELCAAKPQVVLMDSLGLAVSEPRLLRRIQEQRPNARVLMVGMDAREDDFLHAVREGAAGYVLRDASAAEVVAAIRSVGAGEAVCPPRFSATLFRWAAQRLAIRQNLQKLSHSGLSRREQQLVELICWGFTNKEIASRLNLSEHTVKNHIHRILHKTGASDRTAIVSRYHTQMLHLGGESPLVS
ncbi:MAG TPA: response regulator transcription factor [Candidatus Aquilonibacter sp.]|nr:response regulator transcription factor [Candidatus Aquilonibacter sp.]